MSTAAENRRRGIRIGRAPGSPTRFDAREWLQVIRRTLKEFLADDAMGLAAQVAVMRKVQGRWQWIEYTLDGGRYGVLARGSLCTQCHMQARANDWVFTRG